jgi:hypothetical protein
MVMMLSVLGFSVVCLRPLAAQPEDRVGIVVVLIIVNSARRNRGSPMLPGVRPLLGESRRNEHGAERGEDNKPFHGHSEPSPFRSSWGT